MRVPDDAAPDGAGVRGVPGASPVSGAQLPQPLTRQLVRHQFQLSLRPGRLQESLPEHLAVIAAITAGRPAQAKQATRRHLRSVITALLDQDKLDQHKLDQQEEEAR